MKSTSTVNKASGLSYLGNSHGDDFLYSRMHETILNTHDIKSNQVSLL